MEPGIKKIVSEIIKDPWTAVFWPSCHRTEVAHELIKLVDDAIFERESLKALDMAQILRGLSKRLEDPYLQCNAEACLGSVFRSFGFYDAAEERLRFAEGLAGSADNLLCVVYKRWGAVCAYRHEIDRSMTFFDRALSHSERANHVTEICDCLLGRSAICRVLGRQAEGFGNVCRASSLLTPAMPWRYFVAAGVNALSLAIATSEGGRVEFALQIIDELRAKTVGQRTHSRALPSLRWIRGLAFDRVGKTTAAVRSIESAILALERLGMIEEKKAAMADLARIRRKGKHVETNDRHILRLIEECLRLEEDIERMKILKRARRDPSEENILAWRSSVVCYVPVLEPAAENGAIV